MSGKLGAVRNTGAAMADDQHERRVITSQAACDGWGGGNIAAKLKASEKGSAGAIVACNEWRSGAGRPKEFCTGAELTQTSAQMAENSAGHNHAIAFVWNMPYKRSEAAASVKTCLASPLSVYIQVYKGETTYKKPIVTGF